MQLPKLLVFASGSAEGGGSGAENLFNSIAQERLQADIVGFVSNHLHGGVRKRADALKVEFVHFPAPWSPERYQRIAEDSGAAFFAASGWVKLIRGLDSTTRFNSRTVFNIHPGPLPRYGGKGMYGHFVHERVIADYRKGLITHSAVTMHFVTEEYDRGPHFLWSQVPIEAGDTPETLAKRVNAREHARQPEVTNLVVHDKIHWDGINPKSLVLPIGHDPSA